MYFCNKLVYSDLSIKIIANEAVEIAKKYGGGGHKCASGFVGHVQFFLV